MPAVAATVPLRRGAESDLEPEAESSSEDSGSNNNNDDDDDDDDQSSSANAGTTFGYATGKNKKPRLGRSLADGTDTHAATQEDDGDVELSLSSQERRASLEGASESEESGPEKEAETTRETRMQAETGHPDLKPSRVRSAQKTSKAEHRPGAIVRVRLQDFVTYTSAEFFPGPRLNMVIGPNGTGKSTLVCALCLGLGWSPQHLGRARDAAEFVKHGCREATIEIELKASPKQRQNPVICRTIKREGNKSTFALNGRLSTRAAVQELARSFSIQIDNLCQFLPQDKVSEFAAMSPVELLTSTQRAAAGPEMLEWHESLKKMRAGQKEFEARYSSNKESLANLENRQEMQREDVERMRQRAELMKKVEMLELLRPFPAYTELKNATTEAKARVVALEQEEKQLKRQVQPVLQSTNDKKEYAHHLHIALQQQRQLLSRSEAAADAAEGTIGNFDSKIKEVATRIEVERGSITAQRENQKRAKQILNRLNTFKNNKPAEFDYAAFSERLRDLTRVGRELGEKRQDFDEEFRDLKRRFELKQNDVRRLEIRSINLDSQKGQMEERLSRLSPETYRAWSWIQQNQDMFEQPVCGPPLVECTVKDLRYADIIETLLNRNDLISFTVCSRNDFMKLQTELRRMKLQDISIRTCSEELSSIRPAVSDEELRSLGFDGWAKDYFTGPDRVIAMLCLDSGWNTIPVSLRDISDEQYNILRDHRTISSWVTAHQAYSVARRREYGPDAVTTRVRQLRKAIHWTNRQFDAGAKEELVRRIQENRMELEEVDRELKAVDVRIGRLAAEMSSVRKQREQIERDKIEKQNAMTEYNSLDGRIAREQGKLKVAETSIRRIISAVASLRRDHAHVTVERANAVLAYAKSVQTLRTTAETTLIAEIKYIEAVSDYETLKERNRDIHNALENSRAAVTEAKRVCHDVAKHGKAVHQEIGRIAARVRSDPELTAQVGLIRNYTVDQLAAEIDSTRARLELTDEGGAELIAEFEERQRRIERLRVKVDEARNMLDEIAREMTAVRARWEPALDALVARISAAFSDSFARIGCAGQVAVDKASDIDPDADPDASANNNKGSNDFDQWAIQIQVKFRAHESLSVLDSHRQSGGERAVSTIFYLMALQSLSASPFRVVDEINQGMDPRNERMVHGRMVDIACANANAEEELDGNDGNSGGGQYFLITPKLLSGLAYRPGMTVLCIVSGEYVPADYTKLDFGRCLRTMGAVVAGRRKRGIQGTVDAADGDGPPAAKRVMSSGVGGGGRGNEKRKQKGKETVV